MYRSKKRARLKKNKNNILFKFVDLSFVLIVINKKRLSPLVSANRDQPSVFVARDLYVRATSFGLIRKREHVKYSSVLHSK